jgi:hypothetical protein
MRTGTNRAALLAVLAMAGMGAAYSPSVLVGNSGQSATQANSNAQQGERNTGSRGGIFSQDATGIRSGREPNPNTRSRRRGPGWTQAHVKRMAKKARNVKRHRAVTRRSK